MSEEQKKDGVCPHTTKEFRAALEAAQGETSGSFADGLCAPTPEGGSFVEGLCAPTPKNNG